MYIRRKGNNMQHNKWNYHDVNKYTKKIVHTIEQNDHVKVPVEWGFYFIVREAFS